MTSVLRANDSRIKIDPFLIAAHAMMGTPYYQRLMNDVQASHEQAAGRLFREDRVHRPDVRINDTFIDLKTMDESSLLSRLEDKVNDVSELMDAMDHKHQFIDHVWAEVAVEDDEFDDDDEFNEDEDEDEDGFDIFDDEE